MLILLLGFAIHCLIWLTIRKLAQSHF